MRMVFEFWKEFYVYTNNIAFYCPKIISSFKFFMFSTCGLAGCVQISKEWFWGCSKV